MPYTEDGTIYTDQCWRETEDSPGVKITDILLDDASGEEVIVYRYFKDKNRGSGYCSPRSRFVKRFTRY